ncbi:MAG: pectin acetylesterase-family hydrolase [Myxococcota bacterium]
MLLLHFLACTSGTTPAPVPVPLHTGDTAVLPETGDPGPVDDGWAFEPVDGMVCGGGAPTGIGVNEGSDPTRLVVYLVGGGACWDGVSCFVLEAAANLEVAWGEAHLEAELGPVRASGLLDRDDTSSPLHTASWAYVPYCTGDLHIGDAVRYHDVFNPARATHHVGNTNITLVLERLHAEHPDVEELWLLGSSAGGYAAQLQAHRFAETWPNAQLRVFADGSPMIQPGEGRWGLWQSAWNAQLPPGCTGCSASLPAVLAHQAAALPNVPFALDTYTEDLVITLFLAQPLGGLAGPQAALIADQYGSDQLSVFRVEGTDHTMLGNPTGVVGPGGVVLRDWVDDWVAGRPLTDVL